MNMILFFLMSIVSFLNINILYILLKMAHVRIQEFFNFNIVSEFFKHLIHFMI